MVDNSLETFVTESTGYAHQLLSCAQCGEPLPFDSDKNILTCDLCGQGHKSLPPPPTTMKTSFGKGDGVAVLWGEHWWPAHIIEELNTGHYLVHYEGWGPNYDQRVDAARIRVINYAPGSSIIPPSFEPRIKIKRANMLSALGILLVVAAGIATLAYWTPGEQALHEATQAPPSMEAASFGAIPGDLPGQGVPVNYTISPGQTFFVKWGHGWYRGNVIDMMDQEQIVIRYEGWGDEHNELVHRDRLRLIR